jgi:Family of unknown function (DUF6496)
MPEQNAIERALENEGEGKSPSTQAGEFVREEMEHIREGEHGARSSEQAIAIGLSKARRTGVKLPATTRGPKRTRIQPKRDLARGRRMANQRPARTRSRAIERTLQRESQAVATPRSLSRQAKKVARRRGAAARSRSAKKAAKTRKKRR